MRFQKNPSRWEAEGIVPVFKERYLRAVVRAWERTLWLSSYLVRLCEDMSLDPQYPCKKNGYGHPPVTPMVGKAGQEILEAADSLE